MCVVGLIAHKPGSNVVLEPLSLGGFYRYYDEWSKSASVTVDLYHSSMKQSGLYSGVHGYSVGGESQATQFLPRQLTELLEIIFLQFHAVADTHRLVLQNLQKVIVRTFSPSLSLFTCWGTKCNLSHLDGVEH